MPIVRSIVQVSVLSAAMLACAAGAPQPPDAGQVEFFETRVRPLLAEHCFRCHSEESARRGKLKAGLRLDSLQGMLKGGDSGRALVPGEPEQSLLIEAVHYRNEDMAMPPKRKLPDGQIAQLTQWVQMGAPWPGADLEPERAAAASGDHPDYDWEQFRREHWSFRPVARPQPPSVSDEGWVRSPVDRFILATLEAQGMRANPPAERHILIRRAYFDLTGLPPSASEVDAFVTDNRPEAFAELIDRLLDSEHYGERWARHWLDVARYSDGHGGFGDNQALPSAWRFRDWVIGALNADMPYDEFVARQIAGDLRETDPDPVATGFFVVGPSYTSDGGDPEAKAQAEGETLADRVDTFSRAFLGLTAACARCHNHKFDPITAQDYYAIAGIFKNTRTAEHPLAPAATVEAYHAAQKAIGESNQAINQFLDAEAKRLGIERGQIEGSLEGEGLAKLTRMRADLERFKRSAPPKFETAHVLQDSGDQDMHLALRGDLRKAGGLVPRRFFQIIAGEGAAPYTRGSGRGELAQSVTAPDNPLTARVIVNRVWGWHFGNALVRTPSNFGTLGEAPTHPELLDWLAADFMEHGWSLKRLHRMILLSSTWQMSSRFDREMFAKDGDNRLLWRMEPRRLEVEAWRDALLAVTGELDPEIGGPPADEIMRSHRRTLYATISRTGDRFESDSFLRLFDFPAAVATSARRETSTVPQQYLFMMNSPFMAERSRTLGEQLLGMGSPLPERISQVYLRLYSRPAEAAEIELAARWLGESPGPGEWQQYAQVLLSAHELIQIQ